MSEERTSSMPPIDQNAQNMSIITLPLSNFRATVQHTIFEVDTPLSVTELSTDVYDITHPQTKGYLPSKIWWDNQAGFMMLYYVCPSLPNAARPFGDGKTFAFMIKAAEWRTINYPAGIRIFIDQIMTDDGMFIFFLCSEKEFEKILKVETDVEAIARAVREVESTLNFRAYNTNPPGTEG